MLDTTSSNEIPLFGTMPSSSCGMEALVIHRPAITESYSWSDFPIAVQDDSTATATTLSTDYGCHGSYPSTTNDVHTSTATHPTDDDDSYFSYSTSSSTLSTLPSQTSMVSSTSTSSLEEESSNSSYDSSMDSSMILSSSLSETPVTPQKELPKRRSVRFAPSPRVRTYSLVLGNHPMCGDGLAIELGWDYCEGFESAAATAHANPDANGNANGNALAPPLSYTQHIPNPCRTSCQRRSYLSRKQLLLNVAGCTKEELDQRIKDLEADRFLVEQARSHREDYYYGLAFDQPQPAR